MKKVFYLKSCDTCKRILKRLDLSVDLFEFQNIKEQMISEKELDFLFGFTNSYESLFNKRAKKARELNLPETTDAQYKALILNEYTFLKRPIFIDNDAVFIGNSKKTITDLEKHFNA